MLINITQNSFV